MHMSNRRWSGNRDYGAQRVAALVLIVEPGHPPRIDAGLVATVLGLTPAESQLAVELAQGKGVREIAVATGRSGTHPLLASAADLRQAVPPLPADGLGATGAVGHRVRLRAAVAVLATAEKPAESAPSGGASRMRYECRWAPPHFCYFFCHSH